MITPRRELRWKIVDLVNEQLIKDISPTFNSEITCGDYCIEFKRGPGRGIYWVYAHYKRLGSNSRRVTMRYIYKRNHLTKVKK